MNMKTLVTTAILVISATNAMAQSSVGTSVAWPSAAPQQPAGASSGWASTTPGVLATEEPGGSSVVIAGDQAQQVGDLEAQARQMVLVVPGRDLKPETFAAITEDLPVMCRIFDKALYPGKRSAGAWAYMSRGDSLGWLFTQQSGRTQSLYLDGYGAVFFVQVDFPLMAPQQQEEPKPEESADRVWSQTMNELRGQEDRRDNEATGPAYDTQKVDNLKATLIKTLRHAANLRVRPQDQITLVIGSHAAMGGVLQEHAQWLYPQQRRVLVPMNNPKRPDSPEPDPAATLVLHTTKADVDAMAAGKLTADQFALKVQTLWSAARPQTAEPPLTQPPTTVSR
jgi:hypothetical protein